MGYPIESIGSMQRRVNDLSREAVKAWIISIIGGTGIGSRGAPSNPDFDQKGLRIVTQMIE
jgi:hypothetical protein